MVNKYGWVDTGSSFLPSEINSAFLWAQLEDMEKIQSRRKAIWNIYHEGLEDLATKGFFTMPDMPDYATNNAHMFYLVCHSLEERTQLIANLKEKGIGAVFHYLSLHLSDYYRSVETNIPTLPNSDKFADRLVRLPMFYELQDEDVLYIIKSIHSFFSK
jgi:dTDP-4-amino-4,6-dideoxygalactose transaminase